MAYPSLTRQTAAGLSWSWATVVVTAVLQVLYTAVMSRLLTPADFGLMAATLVGLRFVTYFSRFGLASALVQRASLDDTDVSTAMRLAALLGTAAGIVAVLASPALAAVVGTPEAAGVMRWMAITVIVGTLGAVPEALLRRSMRFRALGFTQVLAYVIGYLVVGISTAAAGWGVWSLVAANLTQVVVMFAGTAALARPPVGACFNRSSARSLTGFGGVVSATGFLEFLSSSIDSLAVGRYAGPGALGQYSRATLLVSLPVEQATTATSRVLLPSFSRVQGDPGRFASSVVTVMGLLSLVVAVPTALLAAAAPTLVPWLLGDGWDTAATVVPIVGAANALALLTHTPAVAAEARGAIQRKLALQVLTLATTVGFLGVVVWTGPTLPRVAAAWAFGELARSVFYWVGMFGHLGLDRTAIAHRYLVTGVLAATAAAPVALVVRVLAIPGFWPMALSGAVALLGGTLLVLSPVGRVIRYDLRSVRSRASAPSAADVGPAPSAEPAVAPSADSPLVRAAESLDVAS